ncbi:MAG: hypothetical protein M0Z99_11545 [Betaproteobacteria bacterium]|nr:hypothetical protein [Betaproteobacteria bacterium]
MRRVLNPFLVLLLSLLLLGSQQAALAHMLGHAVAPAAAQAATEVAQGQDAEHGAALVLSHVCTTCISFAGADLAPPAPVLPVAFAANNPAAVAVAVTPAPTFAFIAAFRSRAPPPL